MLTMLGVGASAPLAEIRLTENLGVGGFIDMSTSYDDVSEEFVGGFDRFDLEFFYNYGAVSARADISAVDEGVGFVQGFVTYTIDGFAVTAGKFLSSSGFEAAKAPGLYQYSYSKNCDGTLPGGCAYGGYQHGLALSYGTDMFALYGSVVAGVWDGSNTDFKTPGFEAQLSLTPIEGVTAKVAYLYDILDEVGHDQQQLVNAWASYETGPLTVAAEYNLLMDWGANGVNGNGWLAMINYAFLEKAAVTLRYSGVVLDDGDMDTEVTFSPSYAITDNLAVLAEIKRELDAEVTSFAAEALFTF